MNKPINLFALTLVAVLALTGCVTSTSSSVPSSSQDRISTSESSASKVSSSIKDEYYTEQYQNPCVIKKQDGTSYFVTIADPDIILGDDGYFYMYPTNAECEVGDRGITFDRGPIFKSDNLREWTWAGSVFADNPNEGLWGSPNAGVWAPSVIKIGDNYNYYYSLSSWGDSNAGIGVATSKTPYGPWTHYGKLLDSNMTGINNSIDPQVVIENDIPYIIWGSFFGIACTQLTDDGLELFYGEYVKDHITMIIEKNVEQMDINVNYEGSYIIKKGDYYYYFGSQGTCCSGAASTYRVKVGKSKSLFGPYLGSDGEDIIHGSFGDLVVGPSDEVAGVGHNTVIQDYAGDYWLVYHGYDLNGEHKDERQLYIDKLLWDEETLMPYVENRQASTSIKTGPVIKKGVNL